MSWGKKAIARATEIAREKAADRSYEGPRERNGGDASMRGRRQSGGMGNAYMTDAQRYEANSQRQANDR